MRDSKKLKNASERKTEKNSKNEFMLLHKERKRYMCDADITLSVSDPKYLLLKYYKLYIINIIN